MDLDDTWKGRSFSKNREDDGVKGADDFASKPLIAILEQDVKNQVKILEESNGFS